MGCTISDIARELNLSRNTVSKALKGASGVSAKTQKTVLAKAREMNYQQFLVKSTVQASESARKGTILFLTRSSVDYSEFWVKVMQGMEPVLTQYHYNLALSVVTDEDLANLRFPSIIRDDNIRGIVLVEICDLRICNALLDFRIPMVTVDMPSRYDELIGRMDIITMENKINIKRVMELLMRKGKRRFAFTGEITSSNSGRGFRERYDAMCEFLREKGLDPVLECCITDQPEECFMSFARLQAKLKAMQELPEVFICGNDWTALHMMYTLQSLGHRIPEDISIVGFDNISDTQKSIPPLTTVDTPKELLGAAAANCLIERIQDPERPFIYSQYSTKLIVRESTDI